MSVFSKSTGADAARIEALGLDARRLREFAAQLRDEAVGLWAEDYLALAELQDAKAAIIEAQLRERLAAPDAAATALAQGR